jgi:hypothetical protein
VAVVGRLAQNRKWTAQKEKQYKHNTKHRIHKIENQNTKQKANRKNIKKYKSSS